MSWVVPSASPVITEDDIAAVTAVLRRGVLANGPEVVALEQEFAAYAGCAEVVAVSSGTAALVLAGQALGLAAGHTVLVPAFTFAASANAFLSLGCRVVPVDVDPATMNISAAALDGALRGEAPVKAVVVVDLFGSTAGTDAAIDVARAHGAAVIEDAAQAHGARDEQLRVVGGRADLTTFSLYATKNMAAGEGGLVTTDDAALADTVRRLRSHGALRTYEHETLGLNHRLPEMEAALARGQLARLDDATAVRRRHARVIAERVRDAWGERALVPREAFTGPPSHVFHQLTLVLPGWRDAAADALRDRGVDARQFYPYVIGELPGVEAAPTPVAERLRDTVLSLPVHPGLGDDQVAHLLDAIDAVGAA